MKAIMIMYDSLNRHYLPNYGCDWTHAPNFKRLGERSVTFDQCYVGSMPCMPARRELHTGRYNFLHRSWGPLEPFDDSMPEILKNNDIYTHLVSDHQHYWEDGGCTYHSRYNSWEISRGQEGDTWKGYKKEPEIPECEPCMQQGGKMWRHDWCNRKHMTKEQDQPQAKTFAMGLEFIENNKDEDNWFLQIETFDPHEPFYTQQHYKDLYPHEYKGKHFDWPSYSAVTERDEVVKHGRYQYAALLSMCDYHLGTVLDMMDEHDMWKDTMLIINTDHGFFLGEKQWWSKSVMPLYNEIAHTPFFVWDPRTGKRNERNDAIVQTIDIAPTLLDYFGVDIPKDMQGKPLKETIETGKKIRDAAMYGYYGSSVNITDGNYTYMRTSAAPENKPLYEYTLMPTHMREMFQPDELKDIEIHDEFSFTKGCKIMKMPMKSKTSFSSYKYGNKLFDLNKDPDQENAIDDIDVEIKMIEKLAAAMHENDSPKEQYERLGIPENGVITKEIILKQRMEHEKNMSADILPDYDWSPEAVCLYVSIAQMAPEQFRPMLKQGIKSQLEKKEDKKVTVKDLTAFAKNVFPPKFKNMVDYILPVMSRTK